MKAATTALDKILILEDEQNVGLTLQEQLRFNCYDTVWVTTAEDARRKLKEQHFDLALLDISLPDGTGLDIGKQIKAKHNGTAIIFLTAFGDPQDRIEGLELGAEDYVVKPFHLKELLLRIQNAIQHSRSLTREQTCRIGRAEIWFERYEAKVQGNTVPLSHRERNLLLLLSQNRGKAVDRHTILDRIWSEDEFPSTRTVDNFIVKLRRLVEDDPENPQYIRSVRGVGYQLRT